MPKLIILYRETLRPQPYTCRHMSLGNWKPHSNFRSARRQLHPFLSAKNDSIFTNLKSYLFFPIRLNGDVTPVSPKQPEERKTDHFDGLDLTTEKLSHPTANRAKPPQRRPPSGLVAAIHVSITLING